MEIVTLERVEDDVRQLPLSDQLRLMESLAGQIRRRGLTEDKVREDQLAMMAQDPEIQRELHAIEVEFSGAEADGLNAE